MKVGLFIPCYIDAFFPEVRKQTFREWDLKERGDHGKRQS